jgi:prevent-host-death family protein
MPRQVTATEAKAKILRLFDEAANGAEIEITKHGRPVARLVPPPGARTLKGSFTGIAKTTAADEDLFSTDVPWSAA